MPVGPSMTVEQYLHTSFEYDAEYVAGKVQYRVWPDRSHSEVTFGEPDGEIFSAPPFICIEILLNELEP